MTTAKPQDEQLEAKEKALIKRELELKENEKLLNFLKDKKIDTEEKIAKFFYGSKDLYQKLKKMESENTTEEDIADPKLKETYEYVQGQKAKDAKKDILNFIEENKGDLRLVHAYSSGKSGDGFLDVILSQANVANPEDLKAVLASHEENFKENYEAFKGVQEGSIESDEKPDQEPENPTKDLGKDKDDDIVDNIINNKIKSELNIEPQAKPAPSEESPNSPPASLEKQSGGSGGAKDLSGMSDSDKKAQIMKEVLSKV